MSNTLSCQLFRVCRFAPMACVFALLHRSIAREDPREVDAVSKRPLFLCK